MIRPARAEDVPALADLATRTWLDAFGATVSAEDAAAETEERRSEERFRRALDRETILVADENGALVGYVEFDDSELCRLYVETALQGRGTGRALLEAALAHPRLANAERIVLQVWEENTRAVRLYESVGFRRIGTKPFTIGDELVEDAVFELERAHTYLRPDGRRILRGSPNGELPPGELFTEVDETDAEQLAALAALGFVRHRRELLLVLPTDVPRLSAPPRIEAVRADAVDEATLRVLDDELRQDVPGTDGWRWTPDGFREETYLSPWFDPAVYLVATCNGEHVGICRVWLRPGRPRLGFVGVRRSLRERGIARWLVGETFAVLKARGFDEVETEVDETNIASRALLEGLRARVVGASLELRRPSAPRPQREPAPPRAAGAPRSRT